VTTEHTIRPLIPDHTADGDLDRIWSDVDAALAQLALAVTRLDPEGDSVLFRALALSRIHLERAVRTLGEASP